MKIKNLLLVVALCIASASKAQNIQQSILTSRTSTHCDGAGKYLGDIPQSCVFLMFPGTTNILIARNAPGGITDPEGLITWTKDFCSSFIPNCIYHSSLSPFLYPHGEQVKFAPGESLHATIFTYTGTWGFDAANYGDYNGQNAPFANSDAHCVNGQDCPYNWTLPIELDAGELVIEWSDANTAGKGIAVPGPGWNLEWSNGSFAIADMIAPVPGVYSGSLTWYGPDGSSGGGTHWLMGIAAYKRVN